jgi:predicted O-methyltransferase YrrM
MSVGSLALPTRPQQEAPFRDICAILAELPEVEPADRTATWFTSPQYYPVFQRVGRIVRPRRVLELGTRLGYSLISLLDGSGVCEEITWIDNESAVSGSNRRAAANIAYYLDTFYDHVVSYECYLNHDVIYHMEGMQYDLIHFDSDHSYTGTRFMLSLLRRQFPGAVLLVDDFLAWPEVQSAVLEFAMESEMALVAQPTCQGLAILFDHRRRALLGNLAGVMRGTP